jgi:hypothetical protein
MRNEMTQKNMTTFVEGPHLAADIDEFIRPRGMSRSVALRVLLKFALDAHKQGARIEFVDPIRAQGAAA